MSNAKSPCCICNYHGEGMFYYDRKNDKNYCAKCYDEWFPRSKKVGVKQ